MIAWKPFTHEGTSYDLSHLHPFVHTFEQAEQVGKPARSYPVQVIFSLHCFTRGADGIEDPKGPLGYADSRETRIFDFGRSKLGTGAYDYKRFWGFTPEPLRYRYRLIGAREVPNVNPLNPRYRLMVEAWRRLPLPVANRLGPWLARHLA